MGKILWEKVCARLVLPAQTVEEEELMMIKDDGERVSPSDGARQNRRGQHTHIFNGKAKTNLHLLLL